MAKTLEDLADETIAEIADKDADAAVETGEQYARELVTKMASRLSTTREPTERDAEVLSFVGGLIQKAWLDGAVYGSNIAVIRTIQSVARYSGRLVRADVRPGGPKKVGAP